MWPSGHPVNTAERQIEDLARTVTCPVCGAPPGRHCRYEGTGAAAYAHAHTGQLNKARRQTS